VTSRLDARSAALAAAIADRYRFERELGAGGMATVYLAEDVRHHRRVAIKVVHPDLAALLGSERFLKEIELTASLQHAHILPLFDSGSVDGLLFYVMPYVDGESLRSRLERERQLPVDDAVRLAREVADALDYAHRHGVVHRDVKPENILLQNGHALVGDFGIALAVEQAGGARMTQTGLSLGTPQYMAPEQAMGEKQIDARADVYALGAVTYEMLTGEPPFSGATAQAIVAKVLTEKPTRPSAVRETVPRHVEATVLKALAKLPADRFATPGLFAESLARPELSAALASAAGATVPARHRGRRLVTASPAVWALLAGSVVLAALGWIRRGPRPPAPITKVYLQAPGRVRMPVIPHLAISPDGSRIAFVGLDSLLIRRIYIRALDRVDVAPVAGTEGAIQPFFSSDGQSIAFAQDGKLRTVALRGGAVTTLADWEQALGGTWGTDSTIVFSSGGSLFRVSATGGPRRSLLPARTRRSFVRPAFVPGSRRILAQAVGDSAGVVSVGLEDGSVRLVMAAGQNPQVVDGGILVYAETNGKILAAPFDPRSARVTGPAESITEEVFVGPLTTRPFAVARTGALVYPATSRATARDLVLIDRRGDAHTVPIGQRLYRFPRFSPDGRFLAFHVETRGTVNGDLWRYTLDGGALLRLTTDSSSGQPEWDPDGQSLIYMHGHQGVAVPLQLYRISADGSGAPRPVLERPNSIYESRITPDHRTIVFREDAASTSRDILMASLDSPTVVRPVAATSADEQGLALSPDGKWLAYVSNETGSDEVYIRKLQESSSRWPVSIGGGREPRWIRSGELFYRKGDSVMVTHVELGAEPRVSAARLLFTGTYASTGHEPLWDASPDGSRFAFVRAPTGSDLPMGLLLNWADHWRARRR